MFLGLLFPREMVELGEAQCSRHHGVIKD
jgi:hypothetical protein